MSQDQEYVRGETREQSQIWFTYHWTALKAAREAVSLDPALKDKVRPGKTDRSLVCARKRHKHPLCFSKSLVAIVMCVFVIEYRVNQRAEQQGILDERFHEYIGKNEERKKLKKSKKFKDLPLYAKWRNIVGFSKRTLEPCFCEFIKERLVKWIDIRNDIAHGKWEKIRDSKISPEEALDCYNDITKAIFKLNIALGCDRESEEKSCKEMLLT